MTDKSQKWKQVTKTQHVREPLCKIIFRKPFITFMYSANTRIKHILYIYPAILHWIRQHTVLLPQFLFLKKIEVKKKKIKAKRENFGFFFLFPVHAGEDTIQKTMNPAVHLCMAWEV